MQLIGRIGVVGCGPSAVYLFKHILDHQRAGSLKVSQLHVFERNLTLGHGMPYNPRTTDHYNLCNISSEEIPPPCETLADWLGQQSDERLREFDIKRQEIDSSETYCRIALGNYYQSQYHKLADGLRELGTEVIEHCNCQVIDMIDEASDSLIALIDSSGKRHELEQVVIATGHAFCPQDEPQSGYYASPWPISKLLASTVAAEVKNSEEAPPAPELLASFAMNGSSPLNFTIGLLGASLSAFDVVASLANRHGLFDKGPPSWRYLPHPNTEKFHIVMHSANGWLPHLQYEKVEPFREIYRHATREQIERLRDDQGFLGLQQYFDEICRPALSNAFDKDGRADIADQLRSGTLSLEEFVAKMTSEHDYPEPFAGMKSELPEAVESVHGGKPIHWKETLDDLMYCLNFHMEYLSAEDHQAFRKVIQPFLMNVIAAMPLQSARTLLALHDAGKLQIVSGFVEVVDKSDGETVVEVNDNGKRSMHRYRMFVDCSGQEAITIDTYPFRSLVESGCVTSATAAYRDGASLAEELHGIRIDAAYRIVGKTGRVNNRICDIALPHTAGYRPYSYGLQACDETAAIVVEALCRIPNACK